MNTKHKSVVYVIGNKQSVLRCNYTYVGVTNNLKRRLLQHCGKRAGGAVYTKRSSSWYVIAVVGGLPTRTAALQLERALKHSRRRCSTPVERRIWSIWSVLSKKEGWTRRSPRTAELAESLWVWWHPDVVDTAQRLRTWASLPAGVQPRLSVESLRELLLLQ